MGFFDLFKTRKKQQPEMSQKELFSYTKTEIKQKERERIEEIKSRARHLIEEIKNELPALKNINLEGYKVEEKARTIVKGNLEAFIRQLKRLENSLQNLLQRNYDSLQNLANEAESIIKEFEKNTAMNFEKATFLIGKELQDVAKSIASFEKDIERLVKKNKDIIDAGEAIARIENLKQNIKEKNQAREQIQNEIKEIEHRIEQNNAEQKALQEKLEKTKQSKEYKEKQEKKQQLAKKQEEKKRNIHYLKELIDLKRLAGIFHFSQDKMDVINEMKRNFLSAYDKYKDDEIPDMITSLENKQVIKRKINDIEKLDKEITNLSNSLPKKDEVSVIKEKQKHNEAEKPRLQEEKNKLKKKEQEISEEIKDLRKQEDKELKSLKEYI